MAKRITLAGETMLSRNTVEAIREGYRGVSVIRDPIAAIQFAIPSGAPGFWAITFLSKSHVPEARRFTVEDIEVALSEDTEEKLRGHIVDVVGSKIVLRKKQ